MPGTARTMMCCTVVTLVLITAYSVVFGKDGWLWLGWVTLALLTAATLLARRE